MSFLLPSVPVPLLSMGLAPLLPASYSEPALLTQDLGLLQLAWGVPRGAVPGPPAQVRSPALRDAAPSASGPEAGVGRAAVHLHPGGPGSLQAVGLQLQTPKHILWEVSLARGWGIPLFR